MAQFLCLCHSLQKPMRHTIFSNNTFYNLCHHKKKQTKDIYRDSFHQQCFNQQQQQMHIHAPPHTPTDTPPPSPPPLPPPRHVVNSAFQQNGLNNFYKKEESDVEFLLGIAYMCLLLFFLLFYLFF